MAEETAEESCEWKSPAGTQQCYKSRQHRQTVQHTAEYQATETSCRRWDCADQRLPSLQIQGTTGAQGTVAVELRTCTCTARCPREQQVQNGD